jgi:pantothenate kinase
MTSSNLVAAFQQQQLNHHPQQHKFYTDGRPPWFTSTGEVKQPFVIGVSGGSASGKTSLVKYP